MSVVDHRASFAARGGHPGAVSSRFSARALGSSATTVSTRGTDAGGGGAFHSHSVSNLGAGDDGNVHHSKRHGLTTEAAREVSMSMRDLSGESTRHALFSEALGDSNHNSSSSQGGRRRSKGLLGVAYGAASIKRIDQDVDTAEEVGNSIKSIGQSGRSISSGEGTWLVKDHSKRQSSRSLGGTLSRSLRLEKKDSEHLTPDLEEEPEEAGRAAASTKASKQGGANKSVQFTTIDVYYHPTVLGNNPFVTSGPPLELAWQCEPSATDANIPIDTYEDERALQRRSEWDLALSRGERESRLLEIGCTREEIAAAVREATKIKGQRANTVMNLQMAGAEEFFETVERRGAKIVRLRWSSRWLYEDWKYGSSSRRYKQYLASRNALSLDSPKGAGGIQRGHAFETGDRKKSRFHRMKKVAKRSLSEVLVPDYDRERHYDGQFGITTTSIGKRLSLPELSQDDGHGVWPFAVIKIVYPDSPADEAGLKRGDKFIKVGNITALNNDHCRAIPELGQAAAIKERSIDMVVEDAKGERRHVTIRPRKWDGRGYFGFLFGELNGQ